MDNYINSMTSFHPSNTAPSGESSENARGDHRRLVGDVAAGPADVALCQKKRAIRHTNRVVTGSDSTNLVMSEKP